MILKPPKGAMLNRGHPLARGLVGCWLMNEGGGNQVYDLSGNGATGTLNMDTKWQPGNKGSALYFDGTGDYVNIPYYNDKPFLGEITISVWAMISSGSAYRHFVGKHLSSGSINNPFDFRTDNSTTQKMSLVRASLYHSKEWLGPNVILGKWCNYVVAAPTLIDASPVFYLNGKSSDGLPSSGTGTGSPTGSNAPIRIGSRADGVVNMLGFISSVQIWNHALTASEIMSLYREPFQMFGVDL
jgi:Concanavalin A-like lectin/glucanases superfamily